MQRAKGTDRLLDILETLEVMPEPISRNALAKALNCPRSTVYSLVDQLLERDWLAQSEDGLIALGHRAGLMGLAYSKLSRFEAIATEMVQRVAADLGTVAEINVVDQWQQLVLISATGRTQNYLRTLEGSRYPLTMTGSARLQLVGISPAAIRRHIPAQHFKTGAGQMSPEQFLEEIRQAGLNGYHIARGLIEPYIGSLGTPVCNRDGACVAVLSIVLPLADLDQRQNELLDTLRRGAGELSEHLRVAPWEMGNRARARLVEDSEAAEAG